MHVIMTETLSTNQKQNGFLDTFSWPDISRFTDRLFVSIF